MLHSIHISVSTRVSPQMSLRAIESARKVLENFLPDIYIHSDVYKGDEAGLYYFSFYLRSPGYGISLVAQSDSGALYSSDRVANSSDTPENIGKMCAVQLLRSIKEGGFVSPSHNYILLILFTRTDMHLSKVVLGSLSKAEYLYI